MSGDTPCAPLLPNPVWRGMLGDASGMGYNNPPNPLDVDDCACSVPCTGVPRDSRTGPRSKPPPRPPLPAQVCTQSKTQPDMLMGVSERKHSGGAVCPPSRGGRLGSPSQRERERENHGFPPRLHGAHPWPGCWAVLVFIHQANSFPKTWAVSPMGKSTLAQLV